MAPTKAQLAALVQTDATFGTNTAKAKAAAFDDTRTWIDPNGHRLSDRIWDARNTTRDQINSVLREAVATREDALVTATKLEQFLNPDLAISRNRTGQIMKGQTKSVVTEAPGRGGQGSYSARRLARTEVSRAHAQETSRVAKQTPFARGEGWNLSGSHPKQDDCDDNANADNGLGPGVYPVGDLPTMPQHPHCLCYATIETVQDDEAIVQALRQEFSLESDSILEAPFDETEAERAERIRLARNKASRESKQRARDREKGVVPKPPDVQPPRPPITPPKPPPVPPRPPIVPPPAGTAFVPATTIDEARAFGRQQFNVIYRQGDFTLDHLNTINRDFHSMQADGVISETGSPFISVKAERRPVGGNFDTPAWVTFEGTDTSLTLNFEKYAGVWDGSDLRLIHNAFNQDLITAKDSKGLLTHEWAHIRMGAEKNLRLSQHTFSKAESRLITDEVSDYAAENGAEFIAEVFNQYIDTGILPSDRVYAIYRDLRGPLLPKQAAINRELEAKIAEIAEIVPEAILPPAVDPFTEELTDLVAYRRRLNTEITKQGITSEEQARNVGHVVKARVDNALSELRAEGSRLKAVYDRESQAYWQSATKIDIGPSEKAAIDLRKYREKYQFERRNAILNAIDDFRPIGGDINVTARVQSESAAFSNRSATELVAQTANDLFPTDWINAFNKVYSQERLEVDVGIRAHYASFRELRLEGSDIGSLERNAVHELTHGFEHAIPRIRQLEAEFYARRTAGETAVNMGGSMEGEFSKLDDFQHKYMGKTYSDGSHELATVGYDSLLSVIRRPDVDLETDEDMYTFLLGILVGV